MKNQKKSVILFISFNILCFYSGIAQQSTKMQMSTYGTSCIIQSSSGEKIGIGVDPPLAKLHISSSPDDQTLLKIDASLQGGITNSIGTFECWKKSGNYYYGLFQSKATNSTIIPINYLQNNLGIGVENPAHILDVNGIIGCTGANATGFKINNVTNQPFVFQYFYSGSNMEAQGNEGEPNQGGDTTLSPFTIYPYGAKVLNNLEVGSSITTSYIQIKHNPNMGSIFVCSDVNGNGRWTDASVFSITDSRVGIGVVNSYPDYKLAVNGKILCSELKVKLYSLWPDYVFAPGHKFRTLSELDTYIQQNKHLPDVPTAKEVEKNGIKVGEMNTILLKKVEELTVYIIAMQKEMEQLKAKVSNR